MVKNIGLTLKTNRHMLADSQTHGIIDSTKTLQTFFRMAVKATSLIKSCLPLLKME